MTKDWILGFILAVSLLVLVGVLIPASWWFNVGAMRIADAKINQSPTLFFDRDIQGTLDASRTVRVLRKQDSQFVGYCSNERKSITISDGTLPSSLNLNWLLYPESCVLAPGQYIVQVAWTIHFLGVLNKEVEITSNIFTITMDDQRAK